MAKTVHTMLRILDESRSTDFYRRAFGLGVADRFAFDDFTLVYLRGHESDFELELTVNHVRTAPYALGGFVPTPKTFTVLGKSLGHAIPERPHFELGDLDFLCESTPSVMIGTPDDFVQRLRRLEEMGVDEVLMRVDGVAHTDICRSLELIGHEVIPLVDPSAAAVAR